MLAVGISLIGWAIIYVLTKNNYRHQAVISIVGCVVTCGYVIVGALGVPLSTFSTRLILGYAIGYLAYVIRYNVVSY